MTVGALALADASTLAIPLSLGRGISGILGYDFFLGHVVHVDYAHERVEVLTPEAAAPVFRDPRATIVDGYFDEGIPLVHAAFGPAAGDRFALDTGSPHLLVLAPFERRYRAQIDALWSPATFGRSNRPTTDEFYLEGSIRVVARRAAAFSLAGVRFTDVVVGHRGAQRPFATRSTSCWTGSSARTRWPSTTGGSTTTAAASRYAGTTCASAEARSGRV